jgi:hypothetical protein
MSGIRVGSYVTHSVRPAWGVGKVFAYSIQHVLVGFRSLPESERFKRMEFRPGLLETAKGVTYDLELDSWKVEADSTCHYMGVESRPKRAKAALWTKEEAMERFLSKFANGFVDDWYRSSHRDARLKQHQLWNELLPGSTLREMAADRPHIAAQHILKVLELKEKPLLHAKNELGRVRAAFMRTERMPAFLTALADVIDAKLVTAQAYDAYLAAFGALESPPKRTPMSWPIVTVLPFIANPARHLIVKPTSTRSAAAGLGFDLKFKTTPNWVTYDRSLAFGQEVLYFIKKRGGEDLIDVHAFISALVEA